MAILTVCVVVLDGGNVLLTKRADFHVWCLPSGGVEDGETVVEAALRETREETGLEVKLTRLVGIYSRPADTPSGHAVVFAAVPVGGAICPQPGETLEVRYFPGADLPAALAFGHRQRIEDALRDVCGGAVSQRPEHPQDHPAGRAALYALRDASGLSPEAFYMAHFEPDQVINEREL